MTFYDPQVLSGEINMHYQNAAPSYHIADPRLSYSYYNALPNCSTYQVNPQVQFDLSLPQCSFDVATKSDEELWIETWLSEIGKIQINLNSTISVVSSNSRKIVKNRKNTFPIHSAKQALKNCIHVLDKLESVHEFLKENAQTMSSSDWKKNATEVGVVKDEFSKLVSPFENQDILASLRKAVENRRKKRKCEKRRRQESSLNRALAEEEKIEAEKKIDQWLENMQEQVQRAKMEENMRKDADCVLSEVTKKKADAKKILTLLSSLIKLRNAREQAAIQRGEKVSIEDRLAFEKVSEKLMKMWSNAREIYNKEECGLKLMLEKTVTEDTTAAKLAKVNGIMQQWETALFGPKCLPSDAYYGLTVANRDLDTFIAIRKSWDTFLTTPDDDNGSKIPIGWVTPNDNPQDGWTKFLNMQ